MLIHATESHGTKTSHAFTRTGTGFLGWQSIMAASTEEKSMAPLELERDVEGGQQQQQQGKSGSIDGKE